MAIISAIAAMSENRMIGQDNKLPWHVPEDLKHFKDTTRGKPIIMGRKTFESLGCKPLPGRKNIILTRSENYVVHEGVYVFSKLENAIEEAKKDEKDEVFIGGGEEIYRLAMPLTDRIYLTIIHTTVDGDAKFPEVDLKKDFHIQNEVSGVSSGPKNLRYTILTADRKNG